MAASVRIEDEAFSDLRFDVLARACQLADADHARGKMAALWRQCTLQRKYTLPRAMIAAVLGPNGPAGIVEAGLGEENHEGIRIRGTEGRIEWLDRLRANAAKGGAAKAAKRQPVGSQKATQKATQTPASTLPPPCPPTPAPVTTNTLSLSAAREIREGRFDQFSPDVPGCKAALAEWTWSEIGRRRTALAKEFGQPAPLPLAKITPATTPASYRDLLERIAEEGAEAPDACQYVLEAATLKDRTERTVNWVGEKLFTAGAWRWARSQVPTWRSAPRVQRSSLEDFGVEFDS